MVLLPRVMLRQGEEIFLDDITLDEVRQQLPVPIRVIGGADDLVAVCLGIAEGTP
jgi:NifB/MoaA-like Fe-S oxidoreductase